MTERAQALEALKRVARDIGTVKDVASRRSDPDRDNRRMLARLSAWRSEILRALNILEAVPPPPPVGSPTTDTRQDCTCLGTCRGAEGLGPRWKCALEKSTPVAPAGASEPPSAKLTRVEVINENGRMLTCVDLKSVELSYQDDGRTLKVFVSYQPAPVSPVEPEPPTERVRQIAERAIRAWSEADKWDSDINERHALRDELDAIPAPTGAPAPCVWRDIGSAPKDTALLLWTGWTFQLGHFNTLLATWVCAWDHREIEATHWMPFPTPPLTVER